MYKLFQQLSLYQSTLSFLPDLQTFSPIQQDNRDQITQPFSQTDPHMFCNPIHSYGLARALKSMAMNVTAERMHGAWPGRFLTRGWAVLSEISSCIRDMSAAEERSENRGCSYNLRTIFGQALVDIFQQKSKYTFWVVLPFVNVGCIYNRIQSVLKEWYNKLSLLSSVQPSHGEGAEQWP